MNEEEFKIFLKNIARKDNGDYLAEGTRDTILSNIKTSIPNELGIDSLFDITNLSIIEEYQARINGSNFDERRNHAPKQALKFFKQFLEYKNQSEILKEKILLFLQRAISRDSYQKLDITDNFYYNGYKLDISFGKGRFANKPWMAFLKDNNKVQEGIYPVIAYFYDEKILVVGKGASDTFQPKLLWDKKDDDKSWQTLPADINACHNCLYKRYYTIENINSNQENILDEIVSLIDKIMNEYPKLDKTTNDSLLEKNLFVQNIILYGTPGIGKTYNYKNLISMIEKQENSQKEIFDTIANNSVILGNSIEIPKERVAFITFHQSYSYEDFIEGFRPQEDGTIQLKDGIFKDFCDTARKDKEQNYYFVIDEINRGNISKIFGELITLIEEDKREELSVILPYSKQPFSIPKNLYIIATMNSTDKSIATIDIALRRRFTFIKMKPNPNLVNNINAKDFMIQLNEVIKERLGEDYMVGHSYFMSVKIPEDLEFVKEYKIKPLLEEYFYASGESVEDILNKI